MARAVMRLFPGVQLAFGPTVENGFYYDIESPTPIREDDFPKIEAEMRKIVDEAEPFERFEKPVGEARRCAKTSVRSSRSSILTTTSSSIPCSSFYRQGEFIDLCRGPHIPQRGQDRRVQDHVDRRRVLEERRDPAAASAALRHRVLQLRKTSTTTCTASRKRRNAITACSASSSSCSPSARSPASGLILWMPKGATVRGLLETFIKDELLKRGYQPVYTPHIGRLELYRTSGHFPYYRDAQYPPIYFHPAALALDLAQHRLAAGVLDEKKEQDMLALHANNASRHPPATTHCRPSRRSSPPSSNMSSACSTR